MIGANHPFAKRTLNALDENGNEGCAVCGRPRSAHPQREDGAAAPGQAAYEAGPLGWTGKGIWPPVPWGQLDPEDRKWWSMVGFAAQAAMPRPPDGYPALAAEILDAFTTPTAAVVGNGMIREWRKRIAAAAAAQPAPGDEVAEMRLVINRIWHICANTGGSLAEELADVIKESGMEPF